MFQDGLRAQIREVCVVGLEAGSKNSMYFWYAKCLQHPADESYSNHCS